MQELDFSLNRLYSQSDRKGTALQVGILLDDTRIPRYAVQVIRDVHDSNFATVASFLIDSKDQRPSERTYGTLANLYLRFVDKRYRKPEHPLDLLDASIALKEWASITRTDAHQPPPPLDVLLYFGQKSDVHNYTHLAREGVWRLTSGSTTSPRSLLHDVINDTAVSTARLLRTSANGNTSVLQHIELSPTKTPSVSALEYEVYWGATHLFIQSLRTLFEGRLEQKPETPEPSDNPNGERAFDNATIAKWMLPLLIKKTFQHYSHARTDVHWRIGVRRAATPMYRTPTADTLKSFTWLSSPKGSFWADPFVHVEADGSEWLMFEDYNYALGRAHISCGRLTGPGNLTDVVTALKRPYHLSYPHVFSHEGVTWMIPETSESGKVELYRAVRFPCHWELETVLLELRCVDATVFVYGNKWWMIVSPTPIDSHAPTSLLFSSATLQGPWKLTDFNPILSDVRVSRSAGRIIEEDGQFIRPSQNCGPTYGYSLSFHQMANLDGPYREKLLATVGPQWLGLDGLHTYTRAKDWEAIDGKIYIPDSAK